MLAARDNIIAGKEAAEFRAAPHAQPHAQPCAVRRLRLSNFRNYSRLALDLAAPVVVLSGANGAGKTNLLEAISFLDRKSGV